MQSLKTVGTIRREGDPSTVSEAFADDGSREPSHHCFRSYSRESEGAEKRAGMNCWEDLFSTQHLLFHTNMLFF